MTSNKIAKCEHKEVVHLACVQTSPISFVALGKGRLRDGIANRVPVSCCSGFKFRINYETLSAKQLNCDHLHRAQRSQI